MATRLLLLSVLLSACPELPAGLIPVRGSARFSIGALHPAVSPDGKRLAVSYQGAIGVMPIEGGRLTILSRGEGWDIWPVWSPAGDRIAFVRAPAFHAGVLRVMDARSGAPVELPKTVWAYGPVRFHPDGRRVFGKFAYRGMPSRVSSCDLETGEISPVKGYPDAWGTRRAAHALSPDGKWIYYGVQQDVEGQQGGSHGAQTDVFRLPSAGGRPEKLFQWPDRIYHLCVAPDNGGLYVMTDHNTSHNDVWHLPAKDPLRGAGKLSYGIADEDWPAVSPDGRTVVFTDNRGGATGLVSLQPATGWRRELRVTGIEAPGPVKRLRLKLGPGAFRVSVKRRGGRYHSPPGSMYHISAGLGHFAHRGDLEMTLPVGIYEVRVFKGPEYRPDFTTVTLSEGEGAQEIHPTVTRWVDMRKEGWYSGENHIHANYGYGQWYNDRRAMLDRCEAEDLHVANLVVANSDSDAIFDREFFNGGIDPLSTERTVLWWNEEFRSTIWGHMTLFHLRQLVEPIMTGFKDTTNPWDIPTNGEILRRARMQGGAAGYTHPSNNRDDPYDQPYSAKGLPVDAALGLVDCADVMGNVYPAVLPYWYKLLNAGFQLPASAGTDCFLNRVYMSPPGWGRVYVKVDGEFTYEKWVEGLKRGRSFVSNGPMLEFNVNGAEMGQTVSLDQPGRVHLTGQLRAAYPMDRLELVMNGKVIAHWPVPGDRKRVKLDLQVQVPESGWIALRALGQPVPFWTGREHGAHTNPIYLRVKGHPQPVRESAEYFLEWINRLDKDLQVRNRLPRGEWEGVREYLDLARKVYRAKRDSKKTFIR